MKQLTIVATFVFLLAIVALPQSGANAKAPDVVLKDLTGKAVRLADLRGSVVLLNFWATWCIPCAAEVPDLVKWQDEYRASGLRIVGVTYPPANIAAVKKFVRDKKVDYPILIGSKATKRLFDSSENL